MKLRFLSDLHLEYHRDGGKDFIKIQADKGYDVLVLAGDINSYSSIGKTLVEFRKTVGSRPIIYVPGNHEYWGTDPDKLWEMLEMCSENDKNLHILDNKKINIDGVDFVGSTLWFFHSGVMSNVDFEFSDFIKIKGLETWVGKQAQKSYSFLKENISEGSIVVSHHLPHPESVHWKYQGDTQNRYFLHNVEHLIKSIRPKLWHHGHTHDSFDYFVDSTRVICNPLGNVNFSLNHSFNAGLTIDFEKKWSNGF